MNKQIITILVLGMFLISLASALAYNLTAGESVSFPISEEYDYYSIVGNLTELDLNVTSEGLNVTVTINKYMKSDEFTIIFFNKEKEIIETYRSCGGSSRTIYKDKIINNYVDRYISIENNESEVEEDEEEVIDEEINNPILWIIIVIIGVIALILTIITTRKEKKENKE